MTVVIPANAKGPVPAMMMFGGRSIPEVAFPARCSRAPKRRARRRARSSRSAAECRSSRDRTTDRGRLGGGHHQSRQHSS